MERQRWIAGQRALIDGLVRFVEVRRVLVLGGVVGVAGVGRLPSVPVGAVGVSAQVRGHLWPDVSRVGGIDDASVAG